MAHWAKPKLAREQLALFHPTLDATIGDDHPVRLFDEILAQMDWTQWEAHYHGRIGQPPIHPKVIAAILLYGYSMGMRSSRKLEWACTNCLDVIWLAEGRTIDHSTFCEFRTRFEKPLKDLFRQIGRVAMGLGLIRLNQVGLDGTRVLAHSSRHRTNSSAALAKKLEALEQQIAEIFAQAESADRHDEDLFGRQSPNHLPRKLSDAQKRRTLLQRAFEAAQAKEAKRQKRSKAGGKAKAKPTTAAQSPSADEESPGQEADSPKSAKVPVADPDAAVLPNKDGGHAPNYTPMAAVDGQRGYIVDAEVHAESVEDHTTVATVDRIEEQFGRKPEQFLADGAHGTGPNLAALEARGVDAYIPVESPPAQNPADRPDPTQPVDPSQWAGLPRNRQKKLSRFAFVYDAKEDCYWCPMGRALRFEGSSRAPRRGGPVTYRRYECASCEGCELSGACRRGRGPRRVQHDEHEGHREAMRAKMHSASGQSTYERRRWVCETPFGLLKHWMGFRQFLVRGLSKVQTEWRWACTAYNLRKLARDVSGLRARRAMMAG